MKLKKFEDFLNVNEFFNISDSDEQVDILYYDKNLINEEEKKFLYKFNQVIEDLSSFGSFKYMATDGTSKVTFEEADNEISSSLSRFGLSIEDCRKRKKVIFKNIESYDSVNGMVDILLYKLNPDYKLGGYLYDYLPNSKDNEHEKFIKYSYGYHRTNYGRIFIEQYFGDVNEFVDEVIKKILYLFVIDSNSLEDTNFISKELKEEDYLTNIIRNRMRIYFGVFYDLIESDIIGRDNHDTSYETYKQFFISWIKSHYDDIDDIEDLGDEIDIYF